MRPAQGYRLRKRQSLHIVYCETEHTVGTPFMASDDAETGHADTINGVPTEALEKVSRHIVILRSQKCNKRLPWRPAGGEASHLSSGGAELAGLWL